MDGKYTVRLMRNEIQNFKNVNYGEASYMNYGSINSKGIITKTDIVGVYGQNGSGKTTLIEVIDILKCVISGFPIPYDVYSGILSDSDHSRLTTEFFIKKADFKYKVCYSFSVRREEKLKNIQIYDEELIYWKRGKSSWIAERHIKFSNPYYNASDVLTEQKIAVESEHIKYFKSIPFLSNMQNLALLCSQQCISVLFNRFVWESISKLEKNNETNSFRDVITGIMQFGMVNLSVIKVNQLAAINYNQFIPINLHKETDSNIIQGCIALCITPNISKINERDYDSLLSAIEAINMALRAIVPNLKIEVEKKEESKDANGVISFQIDVYSNRDGKRFLLKYESEGIKRIISILHYLIAVFNNEGVCLVVDELDSGIFEYLLGELLGLMHREMKGQLIFTSHNLRILEKLDASNIICSTVNPNNRYIRLVGIEKNHNKRDFYLRVLSIGGQKEELYNEDDLIAMGYSFRKAGKSGGESFGHIFSEEFQKKIDMKENGE